MRRLDPEVVRRWAEKWCAEQGVGLKVTEAEAVGRAASLLGEGRRCQRAGAEDPSADPPAV